MLSRAILYLIPRTSIIDAILLTGYVGGAVATHDTASALSKVVYPVVIGSLRWLCLYLRDVRLWSLVPYRGGFGENAASD